MGGKAFSQPAQRLDTAQLNALSDNCRNRLSTTFTSVLPLRHFDDKTSHGDLDLVCGWPPASADHTIRGADASDKPSSGDLATFAARVAGLVGGTVWKRFGGEINIAIPTGQNGQVGQSTAYTTQD